MSGPAVSEKGKTKAVIIRTVMPREIVELLDRLIDEGYFQSRSAAIRFFTVRGAIAFASRVAKLQRS